MISELLSFICAFLGIGFLSGIEYWDVINKGEKERKKQCGAILRYPMQASLTIYSTYEARRGFSDRAGSYWNFSSFHGGGYFSY